MKPIYLENNPLRIWLVLTAMCIAIFTAAFNTTAVMNALVAMNNSLHLTPTTLQWIVNAYLLASSSFIVIGGQLGDMFGRRKILIIGEIGFIISSLMIATSHNPTLTIFGRALQGFSAAIITPTTLAIAKVGLPERSQSLGIGIWTASVGLGFAFGPVLSGILSTYFSWRFIFWISIPLMLIALIMTRLFTHHSQGEKQNIAMDLWGLVLLICGLLPLTLSLVEGNVWGWTSPSTLLLLLGGIVILIVFWLVETKIDSPLVHFHHFQEKTFIAGNIGISVTAFVLFGLLYFFNTFIQNPTLFHYSPIQAGLALLPMSISIFIFSFIAPFITKRFGYRGPMTLAFIILAVTCWVLHNLSINATYQDMWLSVLLFGACIGICFSSSPALGMSALPKDKAGEGAGIINTINYYSAALCVAIGTLISVYFGRRMLNQSMADSTLSHINVSNIDKAMFGHTLSMQTIIQQLDGQSKPIVIAAIQKSTLYSFSSVMLTCMIVSLLGAIGIWIFAKNK